MDNQLVQLVVIVNIYFTSVCSLSICFVWDIKSLKIILYTYKDVLNIFPRRLCFRKQDSAFQ